MSLEAVLGASAFAFGVVGWILTQIAGETFVDGVTAPLWKRPFVAFRTGRSISSED